MCNFYLEWFTGRISIFDVFKLLVSLRWIATRKHKKKEWKRTYYDITITVGRVTSSKWKRKKCETIYWNEIIYGTYCRSSFLPNYVRAYCLDITPAYRWWIPGGSAGGVKWPANDLNFFTAVFITFQYTK